MRHFALLILIWTDALWSLGGRNYDISFRGRNGRHVSNFGSQCLFSPRKRPSVGIFKDFKIQFPIRLVAEIIFSSFEKKTETKTLAGRSREIFCVLSSKQRFAMRTKIKPLDPGYRKEFSVGWRQKFFCTEHNFECASLASEVAVNFCATTTTKKISLRKSFIILSFILFSRRKKLLAREETFYALHSVHHK